ncbi:MAG: hypothetical protein AAB706_04305 [Patescibacteria group bacterium]
MKWIYSFLCVLVLVFVFTLSFVSARTSVKYTFDQCCGVFVVGEDTKPVVDIDRMYAATGATIQSNFHAKVNKYFFGREGNSLTDIVLSDKNFTVLYSKLSDSGFSLSD